ncbi:hypothetical protein A1O7_00040 [Cladophialophora yegresii CBS 114405]|uniref:Uncharacterized protein n=1 Tax=Cladophialophora yegresii CBS 114405 TaxID=1182544 RepID=W9WFD4_9EURO|nr:uncharacterized protein A1O7_00040 [Cladophialophora yegresii CBS 114405]EXJ63705.1 hypothetical protein A1O7_00040 [Cladophialophora yegresii CBS 114405]
MASSNPYGTGRFKINVNRVKSKKWKDADKVDYGGGWGDDDDSDDGYDEPAPVSADNPRHPAWNAPSNAYPSDRSVTNPSPSRGGQRPSFDQGDERRHFSSAGNFDSPYPTSQRSPFPEPQHDDPLPAPSYGMQSPLRLNTQGMGATPSDFRPGSRGRQYPPYEDVPMSAPGAFPHQRRSGSSHRPPPGDFYARHESPMRPESRSSISSHRQFPPRKQSLSQQPPTLDFTQDRYSLAPSHASGTATATSANDDRPPPVLIRPSDIYKRMAEEMEKARKSHDSSRSSTALEANRAREDSVGARSTASETKELTGSAQPNAEDSDSTRRLKPTLDPVPERKSEYGFENLLKSTSHDSAQPEEPKIEETPVGVSRHGTDASSVYTDRPDPVSASTLSRNVSMAYDTPARQSSSNNRPSFGLPPIGRISGFGVDIGLSDNTTSNSTPESRQPAGDAPPQVLPGGLEPSESDEPDVKALQHQPTMGYTSVVHQAFDRSQHQEPLTHSSTSSTVDRSNSASTADISPIIGRKPEAAPTNRATRTTHPVISQESSQGETPPTSITTSQPTEVPLAQNDELPVAPVVRPGYRRDVTPPGRDNSPAKKPLEVEPRGLVPPHHGSLVDEQPGSEEHARGRAQSVKDKPLPAEPTLEASTPKAGTPLAIARAESPLKGTVRGLADKLESSSGRSSPSNSSIQVPLPGLSQGRPPPLQARLDSFRPVIPGGWQSYTSSAASGTPGPGTPGQRGMTPPRAPFAQTRAESTESVPTAHAPTGRASHDDSVTQRAFAAAASAGSALAGALAGNRLSERDHSSSAQPSKEESEDEWDQSSSSSDGDADPPASHQLLGEQRTEQRIHHSPVNPPPAGINSSSGTPDQAQSLADSTPLSVATSSEADVPQSTLDYFPAPLRTSRSIDPSSPRPALPDAPIAQETPDKSENERLQQEIVKSLTPKSSSSDIEAPAQDHQPLAHPELSTYRAVTTVGAGPQSTIPAPHSLPSHLIEGPQSTTVPQSDTNSVTEDATTRPPPLRIVPHQPAEAGLSSEGISVTNAYRASDQARPVPAQPRTALHEQPAVFAKPDSVLPGTQQPQPLVEQGLPSSSQPFLQKRFSWETGSSPPGSASTPKATSPPSTGSPDTIRAPFQHAPGSSEVTPPRADFNQPSTRQATSPIQQSVQSIQASTDAPAQQPAKLLQDVQTVQSPQSTNPTQHSGILPTNTNHSQISPTLNEPPTFRTILNLGSPAERIKAFDESRQFYATPNEQLQDWLMSMKTAENADLFATNGRLSLDTADGNASHRPSPRRILTESASARHMQEDGKKLMAAAGRFGGKAGHAAKGLFAKGKEKMRNTSMSEKVAR